MSAEFIAVALIMILFMAFVVVVIFSLSMSAGIRVRKDMLRLLGSYDKIIEVKQQEIDELRKESVQLNNNKLVIEPVKQSEASVTQQTVVKSRNTLPPAATYRQKGFFEGYQHIRKCFSMTKSGRDRLIKKITEKHLTENMRGERAEKLRSNISEETVFQLTQLEGKLQLEMLKGALSSVDNELLSDYLETIDGNFSILGFVDYLDDLSSLESRVSRMYVPIVGDDGNGICEGIQVRFGNRLYDYSISESEIY